MNPVPGTLDPLTIIAELTPTIVSETYSLAGFASLFTLRTAIPHLQIGFLFPAFGLRFNVVIYFSATTARPSTLQWSFDRMI